MLSVYVKGFTLLETIIAVALLAISIVASVALISKSIQSRTVSQNRLMASYLAQEGIELVINIRDNNWKNGNAWNKDWEDCVNCEIDHEKKKIKDEGDPFLKIDDKKFYNYNKGVDTKFKRRITITTISADQKKVSSEVVWSSRGKNFNVTIEGLVYNWQ